MLLRKSLHGDKHHGIIANHTDKSIMIIVKHRDRNQICFDSSVCTAPAGESILFNNDGLTGASETPSFPFYRLTLKCCTMRCSMWTSCGTVWPSSTMILRVQWVNIWWPSSMRAGTAGVRMAMACRTMARASMVCAFSRLWKTYTEQGVEFGKTPKFLLLYSPLTAVFLCYTFIFH